MASEYGMARACMSDRLTNSGITGVEASAPFPPGHSDGRGRVGYFLPCERIRAPAAVMGYDLGPVPGPGYHRRHLENRGRAARRRFHRSLNRPDLGFSGWIGRSAATQMISRRTPVSGAVSNNLRTRHHPVGARRVLRVVIARIRAYRRAAPPWSPGRRAPATARSAARVRPAMAVRTG